MALNRLASWRSLTLSVLISSLATCAPVAYASSNNNNSTGGDTTIVTNNNNNNTVNNDTQTNTESHSESNSNSTASSSSSGSSVSDADAVSSSNNSVVFKYDVSSSSVPPSFSSNCSSGGAVQGIKGGFSTGTVNVVCRNLMMADAYLGLARITADPMLQSKHMETAIGYLEEAGLVVKKTSKTGFIAQVASDLSIPLVAILLIILL